MFLIFIKVIQRFNFIINAKELKEDQTIHIYNSLVFINKLAYYYEH